MLYPAIISKNTDNPPPNYVEDDFVKVRIPAFHGPKTEAAYNLLPENSQMSEDLKTVTQEADLPWARINRGLDNRDFSAQDFEEDDIVYVILENNNSSNPIISGFASRNQYTEDKEEAENNLLNGPSRSGGGSSGFAYTFPGDNGWTKTLANKIVKQAKKEFEEFKETRDSDKYNKAYGNPNGTPWCCAFIWYLYNKCGASKFFYGGNKTASCPTLWGFYEDSYKITTGFDVGDIVFYNGTQHVGLVIEAQKSGSDTVKTIEGNTGDSISPNGNTVNEKSASLSNSGWKITGGITFRKPGLSGTNEEQIFQFLTNSSIGLGFSKEVACGVLANIYKESSYNPKAVGDNNTSFGICQWHAGRGNRLKNYCKDNKLDWESVYGQLEYLKYELSQFYPSVLNNLKAIKSGSSESKIRNAADVWCRQFEIPANVDAVSKARQDYAVNNLWPLYKNYKTSK